MKYMSKNYKKMKMPKKLNEFLCGKLVQLSKEEADSIWAYFDGEQNAVEKVIEEVVNGFDLMDYWKFEKDNN
jgi:hypothetical protein